jgi:hypothetical protein
MRSMLCDGPSSMLLPDSCLSCPTPAISQPPGAHIAWTPSPNRRRKPGADKQTLPIDRTTRTALSRAGDEQDWIRAGGLRSHRAVVDVHIAGASAAPDVSSDRLDGRPVSIEPRHRTRSLFLCERPILGQAIYRHKCVPGGSLRACLAVRLTVHARYVESVRKRT